MRCCTHVACTLAVRMSAAACALCATALERAARRALRFEALCSAPRALHVLTALLSPLHIAARAEDFFKRCQKYGTATFQASHPELNAYVAAVLANARPHLEDGSASQLVIVIRDVASGGSGSFAPRVHERFVFDVTCAPPSASAARRGGSQLVDELRTALMRIMMINASLARQPCSDGSVTHEVLLYAAADPNAIDRRAWIVNSSEERRAVELLSSDGSTGDGGGAAAAASAASAASSGDFARRSGGAHVIPIKSMAQCEGASLQISVEEQTV